MIAPFLFGLLLAIDPTHSKAQFSVEHIFVERVTGSVPILRGSIDLPSGSLIPAHVSAELDASHLKTDDSDRDDALRSRDWFDTAQFPVWTFVSNKIVPTPSGFTIVGTLTIHGVSQPETLNVVASGTGDHPAYHASCRVDRHAFGMQTNRLDPAIGNPVDVTLDIAVK